MAKKANRIAPEGTSRGSKGKAVDAIPQHAPSLPLLETKKLPNLYSESEVTKCLVNHLTQAVTAIGYREDVTYSNIKLAVLTVACTVAACGAYFMKVPENRFLLGCVVVFYFACANSFQAYEYFYKQSEFIGLYDRKGNLFRMSLTVRPLEGRVEIVIRNAQKSTITKIFDLGPLFDDQGYLVTDASYAALREMLVRYETNDYDPTPPAAEAKKLR